MSFVIKEVIAREILDSRGNPTIECDIHTSSHFGRAAVPSGASTGKFEAVEKRDGRKRYLGLGVKKAVKIINKKIAQKIIGKDCRKQQEIDNILIKLDGTENKSSLGANSLLAVSLAVAKVAARDKPLYQYLVHLTKNKPVLPVPFCNVINGGKHAGTKLKFQEFMLVPQKFNSFSRALQATSETYHILGKLIEKKYGKQYTNVGDEGGFTPNISSPEEVLELLKQAVKKAGYSKRIFFAMDAAASSFYDSKNYLLNKIYSSKKLLEYYLQLIKKYPLISIEDPFHEEDFTSFAELTKRSKIQIVGDDLLVTNEKRIQHAINEKSCNCLLLKVNQIGTLTEALESAKLAKKNNWKIMVSHRSGETEDTFIADLSVALGCGQIKTGAPVRGERTAKYNRLLRIEENKLKYG